MNFSTILVPSFPVNAAEDPLHNARARLEDTLRSVTSSKLDHALLPAVRNAIECLGGLARFGVSAADMQSATHRIGEVLVKLLDRDPGEALGAVLLEQRAMDLTQLVTELGSIARLDADDRESWTEAAVETLGMRDSADAWLLGASALLRSLEPGPQRDFFERCRERVVGSVARFDRALKPAMGGLSVLRETSRVALMRARGDKGYARRAWYWRVLAQ